MYHQDGLAQFIGLGICIMLPLIMIILNGIALRRHRTNRLCAISIMVTLLAIILFSLSGLGVQTTHVPLHVIEILSITGAGLMLVSTVFAIIGLIQRALRHRYTRGKWRAVIALLLNATFLTFIIMNIVHGVQQGIAWRNLLQTNSPPGTVVTNEAWNFRIQPPQEWNSVNPETLGPGVRAGIGRSHPEIHAEVFAQEFPVGVEPSLAAAMDFLKQTLHADGKMEFLAEEEREDREFLTRTMEMRSHEKAGTQFHVHWITRNGNTLYHIHTWGDESHATLIRQDARKVAEGFDIIDRRHTTAPKPPAASLDGPVRLDPAAVASFLAVSGTVK